MYNNVKLTGNVKLYSLPPDFTFEKWKELKNKEKYLVDEGHNLVVDAGIAHIINLMTAASTSAWTHCATGSGTNVPAAGDIALQTELVRNTINDRYRVGLNAHFDTFFAKADGAGSWEETGLFTASSGGQMLCRKAFSATFTKSTSNAAIIAWTITFAAVAD